MTLDHADAMIAQFLHDAKQPDYPHLVDMAELFSDEPTDIEILDALVEAFDIPHEEMLERLTRVDVKTLREVVG
ncbi:MAG: hypothetical protein ACXU89_09420 [Xanthobacteraceae bacterium]